EQRKPFHIPEKSLFIYFPPNGCCRKQPPLAVGPEPRRPVVACTDSNQVPVAGEVLRPPENRAGGAFTDGSTGHCRVVGHVCPRNEGVGIAVARGGQQSLADMFIALPSKEFQHMVFTPVGAVCRRVLDVEYVVIRAGRVALSLCALVYICRRELVVRRVRADKIGRAHV